MNKNTSSQTKSLTVLQKKLAQAYRLLNIPVDSLPYTEELSRLAQEFQTTEQEILSDLLYLRKTGNLPRIGRITSKSISSTDEEINWIRQQLRTLLGTVGRRDQLPYSELFDDLQDLFIDRFGRSINKHDFWHLISRASKLSTHPSCPTIPLASLRRNRLADFIRSYLVQNGPTSVEYLYEATLQEFGTEYCEPKTLCEHYRSPHPEYKHQVRHTLRDLKDAGYIDNPIRGVWKIVEGE